MLYSPCSLYCHSCTLSKLYFLFLLIVMLSTEILFKFVVDFIFADLTYPSSNFPQAKYHSATNCIVAYSKESHYCLIESPSGPFVFKKLSQSEIEKLRQEQVAYIAASRADTYDEYKKICGVIRGLNLVDSIINDLVQKMEYSDE